VPGADARPAAIRPRVKLWVESDGESFLCGGLCRILRAVDEAGSIKHAAGRVGRSYRSIWSRIKQAEQALGHPLVETQVGGADGRRSSLTPLAKELLEQFESLRDEVGHLVDEVFARRLEETLQRHGLDSAGRTSRSVRPRQAR
jgi:molybdate transport system regulatory protein